RRWQHTAARYGRWCPAANSRRSSNPPAPDALNVRAGLRLLHVGQRCLDEQLRVGGGDGGGIDVYAIFLKRQRQRDSKINRRIPAVEHVQGIELKLTDVGVLQQAVPELHAE